jgi:uncharacterized protein
MLNEFHIIDADTHVFEPSHIWAEYLEPAFKSFAPSPDLRIKGERVYQHVSDEVHVDWTKQIRQAHPMSTVNGFDAEYHVRGMKQMGIDCSFIFPTSLLFLLAVDTMAPQLAGAFTRAYNNWLHDFCSYDPKILRGVGAINLHAPEEIVPELYRLAEFGWKAVFLRPNPVKGRLLSDLDYELFWTACEDLGIAVCIHEGTHSNLPTAGADRFHTRFALHACSHPMEHMMALLALIEGGVLERHPKLRVGFLESGCGWLPYWLNRLDEEYESLYWEVKNNVKMKPSEYFHRHCFVGIGLEEPYIDEVIKYVGSDNLIFGSDYPHIHWNTESHKPDTVDKILALQNRLPREVIQKILWDNPAHFYGVV